MVGVRAQVLDFEPATVPQLALQTGAPLVHALRGLVLRGCHDQSAAGAPGKGARCRNPEWVGQTERRQSGRPVTLIDRAPWRVRIEESVAVSLIRVVINTAAGPKHRLIVDPVCDAEAWRPIIMV